MSFMLNIFMWFHWNTSWISFVRHTVVGFMDVNVTRKYNLIFLMWLLRVGAVPAVHLQGAFPGNLQLVLVLRPSRFFQRAMADIGIRLHRDDFKMKVGLGPRWRPCGAWGGAEGQQAEPGSWVNRRKLEASVSNTVFPFAWVYKACG